MTLKNAHVYMHQIVVVVDTNAIYNKWNENNPLDFRISRGLAELVEEKLKNNSFYISLFITEITYKELIQQQIKHYEKKNNIICCDSIKQQIQTNIEEVFQNLYIKILDCSQLNINNLINRAIQKRPPFCGKKGKSDAGFKDAVTWECVLTNDEIYRLRPAKIIIISDDGDFKEEILIEEFKNEYRDKVNIEFVKYDWKNLTEELDNLFFELFANSNLYEPIFRDYIKNNCADISEVINSRVKIQKIPNFDFVQITSLIIDNQRNEKEILFNFNFKTNQIEHEVQNAN